MAFLDQYGVMAWGAAALASCSSTKAVPPGTQHSAESWNALVGRCDIFHTTAPGLRHQDLTLLRRAPLITERASFTTSEVREARIQTNRLYGAP